jgi:LPS-assembly protein
MMLIYQFNKFLKQVFSEQHLDILFQLRFYMNDESPETHIGILSGHSVQLNRFIASMAILFGLLNIVPAHALPDIGSIQDSPDKPWHITADEISHDQQIDQYIASGHVTISKEARQLSADFVRFDHKTMMAYASGHVMMTAGDDVLTGSSLEMNLASEIGTLYEGTIFIKENHFYIRGDKLQKVGEKSYAADTASVSSCDGDVPDWKITGKNMTVTIEGYGTVHHAALWAKQVPVLYSPYLIFPAKTQRQSGFLVPEAGYSERNGFEFSQPFYWAINNQSDATFNFEHIANRGEKVGVEYRYVPVAGSKGIVMMDYLNDRQVDDGTGSWGYTDDNVLRTNLDRYWFRMKHNQAFSPGFNAMLDMDIVSDQDYLHEFRGMYMGYGDSNMNFYKNFGRGLDDYNETVRINRLIINKYWSGYAMNAETRWYDNVIARQSGGPDDSLQLLPVVQFYGSKKYLFETPLFMGFDTEVANFYRKDGTKGQRADIYPKLSFPWRYQQYFTIEPSVGIRETAWYSESNENGPSEAGTAQSRSLYDVNLNLSSELFNVFQVNGESVERIKHILMPRISYSFIPEYNQASYPYFDQVDRIQEQNLVTFSLTNTFISKLKPPEDMADRKPGVRSPYSYREFLRFLIEQGYDIHQADQIDPKPLIPLYAEIQLEPYRFLAFQADAEWSHDYNDFKSRNFGTMVSDVRGDRLFVEYRYEKNDSESVYTNLLVKLSDRLMAYMDYEQNLQDSTRIQSGVGMRYQSQCWSVDIRYIDEVNDRQYIFLINLTGLGGFGSGSRDIENISGRTTMFNAPYQVIRSQ